MVFFLQVFLPKFFMYFSANIIPAGVKRIFIIHCSIRHFKDKCIITCLYITTPILTDILYSPFFFFFFFFFFDLLSPYGRFPSRINPKLKILQTDFSTPWTDDQPVASPLPVEDNTNTDKHPCLEWDSETRSYFMSGQKYFVP
jgi:hypothetical protein